MPKYILSLDQGTSSSRAILFDHDGVAVGQVSREFPQIYPQPGWVSHDPEAIWSSQLESARQLLADTGTSAGDLAAIGITNQRETTVVWDRASGRAVADAVVWQCRRTAGICEELRARGLEPEGYAHTLYEALFVLPFFPDQRLSPNERHTGNLSYFLWLEPLFTGPWLRNMEIHHRGEYDPHDKDLFRHNTRLMLRPTADYSLILQQGWIREGQEYVTGSVRRLLTEKWEAEIGVRYDLDDSSIGDRFATLRRRAHQWIFEMNVEVDEGDNDTRFSVTVTPLALFGERERGSLYDPMQPD